MVGPKTTRVAWPKTHRLVMSHFPPIDLYDDIADPRDWEALAIAQSRTNPRIYEEIGDLSLVPVERRLTGEGASWVMAAFTHISPDRQSRFSDGTYGVYYAAKALETAFREHTFHMGRFYADSKLTPGWISEVRQLIGLIDADLIDLRPPGYDDLLNPDPGSYPAPQSFAREQKSNDKNGIVYPSQRHTGGECIAAFFPDVVTPPKQGDHFRYHWNGDNIDFLQQLTGDRPILQIG
ncbi:MAG: RES family NAD+ phosphorylase [Rhodobacteraceae bacterium]|nr:RES family NAD+ phosphorylase [Paracoccaceae bacterium]